ncbi:MAG: hypothetical protein ABGY75_06350, partial [Gemmataceae bacterium]
NSAVRISFKTDVPFYQYREPEDARSEAAAKMSRTLRVFVLSDSRVSGTIGQGDGATPFPGRTVWSNKVDPGRLVPAASQAKLPEPLGSRGWHLTEFEDRSSPRPGTDEVYFSAAGDQSTVERPPHVIYEYYDPWPWVWLGVFALGAALVVLRVGRAMTKKKAA